MQMKPAASYPQPAYPTGGELACDPGALRVLPERWRGSRVLRAARLGAL